MGLADQTLAQQCIDKCDKVIAAKNKELKLADLAIQQAKDELGAVKAENDRLKDSENSPFHNPFLMTTIGMMLGAIVTGSIVMAVKLK